MCNSGTRKAIHEKLNEKVETGTPFTAYEVEQELRASTLYVSRDDVKGVLTQRFKRNYLGNMLRSQANLPGSPWVYHEYAADLTQYGLTVRE